VPPPRCDARCCRWCGCGFVCELVHLRAVTVQRPARGQFNNGDLGPLYNGSGLEYGAKGWSEALARTSAQRNGVSCNPESWHRVHDAPTSIAANRFPCASMPLPARRAVARLPSLKLGGVSVIRARRPPSWVTGNHYAGVRERRDHPAAA